jgi:hypothetical protein
MPSKFKNFGIYFKCHDKKHQKTHFCCSERGLAGERENIEGIDSTRH